MPIRLANLDDLDALCELENACFDTAQRQPRRALKRSLTSAFQRVYFLEEINQLMGAITLFVYKNSVRLYSIAVHPDFQGQGLGKTLMTFLIQESQALKMKECTLEVDLAHEALVRFYQKFGFEITKTLPDYYGLGRDAFAMRLGLSGFKGPKKNNVHYIVIDTPIAWLENVEGIEVIHAEDYINDEKYLRLKNARIYNLCASYDYQSLGYYVSLMATARNHRVVPNVATVNDFSDPLIIQSFGEEAADKIHSSFTKEPTSPVVLRSYFGFHPQAKYDKVLKSLYPLFEAPFVEFTFEKGRRWTMTQAKNLSLIDVMDDPFVVEAAKRFFLQKKTVNLRLKEYLYDLAILYDPHESEPPSNKMALAKFKTMANKFGFYVEFITKDDYARLTEFDALLIRMTTNVNDISYQFSRYAYAEGLVVLDDPWSILKCSNKLFFTESMKKLSIRTPKTVFVSAKTPLSEIIEPLQFPIILKQPDSAFSLGVFKVNTENELKSELAKLLKASALVVAQSYIPSTFDWRIGVIDGAPFYACQYFMATNHWQIMNWQSKKRKDREGSVTAWPLEEVPSYIVEAAVKAAKAMGDGLYGVDLKEHDEKAYVIEVNDNPSIDHGYEDLYYKDALYKTIIKTIFNRIEDARGHVKIKAE